MKLSSLILIIFVVFVFVRKDSQEFKPGFLSYWESKLEPTLNTRTIAAAREKVCAPDRFTEDHLLNDYKDLYEKQVLSFNTRIGRMERPLRDLNFKNQFEKYMVEQSQLYINTSIADMSCEGILCLTNTAHTGFDQIVNPKIPGHFNLWLYLKHGYFINNRAKTPTFSVIEGINHTPYLFTELEQQALFDTFLSGPEIYSNLKTLDVFYRFARGYNDPKRPNTAALASSAGYIYFLDSTFQYDYGQFDNTAKGRLTKGSRITIAHEIAHHLDYSYDFTIMHDRDGVEFSSISGWYKEDYIDDEGKKQTQWKFTGDKNAFIRDYAATTPGEDFADHVGYFRFRPEEVKKVSQEKYDFIKDKIFKRSYLEEDLLNFYATKLYDAVAGSFESHFLDCSDNPTEGNPKYLRANLPNSVLSCIENKIIYSFDDTVLDLFYNEFESCHYFNYAKTNSIILNKAFAPISRDINLLINLEGGVLDAIQGVKELRSALQSEIDFKEVFIFCQSDTEPKACYENHLYSIFEEYSAPFVDTVGEYLESQRDSFYERNSFDLIGQKVEKILNGIFKLHEPEIFSIADNLNDQCLKYPMASQSALFYPYSGGQVNINQEILNCINHHLSETVTQYVADNLEGPYDMTEYHLAYIAPKITEKLINIFSSDHLYSQEIEKKLLDFHKDKITRSLLRRPATLEYCDVENGVEFVDFVWAYGMSFNFHDEYRYKRDIFKEVCSVDNAKGFVESQKEKIKESLSQESSLKTRQLLNASNEIEKFLESDQVPYLYFYECKEARSSKSCYETKIADHWKIVSLKLKDNIGYQYRIYEQKFNDFYSYESIKNSLETRVENSIGAQNIKSSKTYIANLFLDCLKDKNDFEGTPTLPSRISGYPVSSNYRLCLETNLKDSFGSSDLQYIWMKDYLIKEFNFFVAKKINDHKKSEYTYINLIRDNLSRQAPWPKQYPLPESILKSCRSDDSLASNINNDLFHFDLSSYYRTLIQRACDQKRFEVEKESKALRLIEDLALYKTLIKNEARDSNCSDGVSSFVFGLMGNKDKRYKECLEQKLPQIERQVVSRMVSKALTPLLASEITAAYTYNRAHFSYRRSIISELISEN